MVKIEQVTPMQALENAALFLEWSAEDAKQNKNLSHHNEFLSYAKVLRQLKQLFESEVTMIYDAKKRNYQRNQSRV